VRNLTKTLAAVMLMAPMGAHPLGIGDIELHSALNQKLNAEIFLNLSEGEHFDDIKVKLAPPEKFEEVGIPRSYILSQIKFKPVEKADGSVVVQLSSKEVIKEPFLDFLLEVSWPKGSIYREFSVLIDPPLTYQQTVLPVVSESSQKQQVITRSGVSYAAHPEKKRPSGGLHGIDQYTVRKNDTLWEIAQKVKSRDVSVEQMMIALFEANPQAFYKANINALIQGKTLKIPEKSTLLKISRKEARAEFNRQAKRWRNGGVSSEPVQERLPDTLERNNKLKLLAPVDMDVHEQERITAQSENTELPGPEDSASEGLNRADTEEIKARLAKLEHQLNLMQKMLAVKDEQIALLQKEKTKQSGTRPARDEPVIPAVKQVRPSKEESEKKPPEVVKPEVHKKAPEKIVKPATHKKTPEKIVKSAQPAVETEEENSDILYYMIVGSVGLTILGLLGWLLWRQKMLRDEDNTESMFAASSEIVLPEEDQELTIPVVDEEEGISDEFGTAGESSFLSEFIPSDFDAFDTEQTEVDPISEADVYLAYGRYQQAEELMRQAIEEHPERDECKLKLLEIFYSNEDKQSFIEYAKELAEAGKKDEVVFWTKVSEMGSELAPDEVIFSTEQAAADTGETDKTAAPSTDETSEATSIDAVDAVGVTDDVELDSEPGDEKSDNDDQAYDLSALQESSSNEAVDSGLGIESGDDEKDDFLIDLTDEEKTHLDDRDTGGDIDFSYDNSEGDEKDDFLVDLTDEEKTHLDDRDTGGDIDFSYDNSEGDEKDDFLIDLTDEEKTHLDDRDTGRDIDFSSDNSVTQVSDSGQFGVDDMDFGLGLDLDESDNEKQDEDLSYEELNDATVDSLTEKETSDAVLTDIMDTVSDSGSGSSKVMDFEVDENQEVQIDDSSAMNLETVDSSKSSPNEAMDSDSEGDSVSKAAEAEIQPVADEKQEEGFSYGELTQMDELDIKIDLAKAYFDMGDAEAAKAIAGEILEKGTNEQKQEAKTILDTMS